MVLCEQVRGPSKVWDNHLAKLCCQPVRLRDAVCSETTLETNVCRRLFCLYLCCTVTQTAACRKTKRPASGPRKPPRFRSSLTIHSTGTSAALPLRSSLIRPTLHTAHGATKCGRDSVAKVIPSSRSGGCASERQIAWNVRRTPVKRCLFQTRCKGRLQTCCPHRYTSSSIGKSSGFMLVVAAIEYFTAPISPTHNGQPHSTPDPAPDAHCRVAAQMTDRHSE